MPDKTMLHSDPGIIYDLFKTLMVIDYLVSTKDKGYKLKKQP